MDAFQEACRLLPGSLRQRLENRAGEDTEELRLRAHRPMSVVVRGRERALEGQAVSPEEIMQVLEKATGASLHSAAESLANGFICYHGLRVGLCGEAALAGGQVAGFRHFSSLAIRIPHQCLGVCDRVADTVFAHGAQSALVISPPGVGKTTALRELIRLLADRGLRVAVVDERNELSATAEGRPGHDLGRCSDVLVNVPKAQGAMMLLRSMGPELIAMDEISQARDIRAVEAICGCGVSVLASAHAARLEDMRSRPLYRELLGLGAFDWLISISLTERGREYRAERLGS